MGPTRLAMALAVLCISTASHAQSVVTRCDELAAFPFDPARIAAGVLYDRLNPASAIPACDQAVAQYPNSGRLWFQFGRALERANRLTDAIDAYGAARRLGHPGGANNLGELFRQGKGLAKDSNRAEALFREAAQTGYPEGAFNLASNLMRRPTYDASEVRRWLDLAATVDYPNSRRLLASLQSVAPPTAIMNSPITSHPVPAPPAAPAQTPVVQVQVVSPQPSVDTRTLDLLAAKIDMLGRVLERQNVLAAGRDADASETAQQSIAQIEEVARQARSDYSRLVQRVPNYSTPIRPTDADLYLTARKESELFPKVPYFISGTPEIGEFWVEPIVEDDGTLAFRFRFIDPTSVNDKTRSEVRLKLDDAEKAQRAIAKLGPWSKKAKEQRVRTSLEVRADCFPTASCPQGDVRRDGQSSTEIIFIIRDDGSTMGRLQRNKGRFADKYDFSIESAMLLQSYMSYVIELSKSDVSAGSKTKEELKQLFR